MNRTIAEIRKNKRERICVELREFKGNQLLSLRIWFVDDIGRLLPSQKGLSVGIRHLAALRQALVEAEQVARENGLMPS
jgi:hypothetical protein